MKFISGKAKKKKKSLDSSTTYKTNFVQPLSF